MVGADEAGASVEALLRDSSIHSYLKRDEAISTIIKLRVIGRQQQMVRIDFEDAPSETVLRDKLTQFKALLPDFDVLIFSDYNKGSLVNVAEMIRAGARRRQDRDGRPEGRRFLALRGRQHAHAEQIGAASALSATGRARSS